jgi:glycosyltransferase involved in cell wall biosynthesis
MHSYLDAFFSVILLEILREQMKIDHIYWFAPYNLNCASTRYRGKYPLEYLARKLGLSYHLIFPGYSPGNIYFFLTAYLSALLYPKKNALIVIQKVCTNGLYAKALKLLVLCRPERTLFDMDDAEQYRQPTKTLHFFLRHCRRITAGSEALRKYCLQFNPNVTLQTSPVPEHQWKKTQKNDFLTIGWVGDFGQGKSLEETSLFSHKRSLFTLFFPQLKKVKFPVRLVLIGIKTDADIPVIQAYFKDCPNVQLHIPAELDWEQDDWVYPMIAEFDIGIAPMLEHPFNKAKSAFKAKQYLSCGIPVIASDLGEHQRFIRHGLNGFLCRNGNDFKEALERIYDMGELQYMEISQNALNSKSSFTLDSYCRSLLSPSGTSIKRKYKSISGTS